MMVGCSHPKRGEDGGQRGVRDVTTGTTQGEARVSQTEGEKHEMIMRAWNTGRHPPVWRALMVATASTPDAPPKTWPMSDLVLFMRRS